MIGKDVCLTIGNLLNEIDYSNKNNENDLIDYLFQETEKLSFQISLWIIKLNKFETLKLFSKYLLEYHLV